MTTKTKNFIIATAIASILAFVISSTLQNTKMVAPIYATTLIVGIVMTKKNNPKTKQYVPFLILGVLILFIDALFK